MTIVATTITTTTTTIIESKKQLKQITFQHEKFIYSFNDPYWNFKAVIVIRNVINVSCIH